MKKIYMLGLAASLCLPLAAQTPRNGYFSENLPMRHNLNPAFAPKYDYVAIPAIGGISAGNEQQMWELTTSCLRKMARWLQACTAVWANDEFLSGLKSRKLYGS